MRKHAATLFSLVVLSALLSACSLPSAVPTPTEAKKHKTPVPELATPVSPTPLIPLLSSPTAATFPSLTAPQTSGGATQAVADPVAVTQVPSATFCADSQPTALINSFKSAVQGANGTLLASLVSPTHGMDARLFRDGRIVNYDQQHAKFLFETTYVVNWGNAPGSGLPVSGSFHERIVPDLLDVFSKTYTLTCNQIQVGGTTYTASWPYTGINYYSVYYPGTQAGGQDWHTWLLGMHYINNKPYLYAIMQFKWEP